MNDKAKPAAQAPTNRRKGPKRGHKVTPGTAGRFYRVGDELVAAKDFKAGKATPKPADK